MVFLLKLWAIMAKLVPTQTMDVVDIDGIGG